LARGIEPATDASQRFEQHRAHAPALLTQERPEKGDADGLQPAPEPQAPVRFCQAPGCDLELTGRQRRWCPGHRRSGSARANARERATSLPVTGKAATPAAT